MEIQLIEFEIKFLYSKMRKEMSRGQDTGYITAEINKLEKMKTQLS